MDSSFPRSFQGYIFGSSSSTTGKGNTIERSISPHTVHRPFSQINDKLCPHGNPSASVALPRLGKGAVQHEMIVAYLYQQQRQRFWISDDPFTEEGAFMRETWSEFITAPAHLSHSPLAAALIDLNAEIVITMKSSIVEAFFRLKNDTGRVWLQSGLQIQMIPSIRDLKLAQKHQCAAFVQDESFLLIWDDDPNKIIERAADLENQLVAVSWRSTTGSYPKSVKQRRPSDVTTRDVLLEAGGIGSRPRTHINSAITCLTLVLSFAIIGMGFRVLVMEITVDKTYRRLAVIAYTPIQFVISLFFMQIVVVCGFQLLGPITQCQSNTKYFSGSSPCRMRSKDLLPHVTIQCPVYTESLEAVLENTIISLKEAISTYEMQGGSANIFVNDDGMLSGMSQENIDARKRFYKKHNIGWVARPRHNPNPKDGSSKFLRRGRFKKASNMNYALALSTNVEAKLSVVDRPEDWSQEDERIEYDRCLLESIEEQQPQPLASGDIRIGDYILLVDSDTRIPADCLLDAVSEMEQSPEVAILQYTAGVLHVSDDFFERGISYFTDLIYTAIGYMVSNGDVAPFVGHNAVLRWQALQDVSFFDEDKVIKFWSESCVSEDFDMALRLQFNDWIIRFAGYTKDGFKEGVSLTIYDEITRWEKYAYGCSELVFHPLKDWPRKGPFTKTIRKFIWSSMPLASKFSVIGYIGSYYAIGSGWIIVMVNYFLVGWGEAFLDNWYLQSFDVFIGLLFIFGFVCNVALAFLRYRTGEKRLVPGLIENFTWLLLFTILFGGLSFPISKALLCHLLSIDISWSTTQKEVENSNFFQEAPKILKQFKYRFLYCGICVSLILVCAFAVPYHWQIREFVAIFPLSLAAVTHFVLPIVLNPAMMKFTW